MEVCYPTSQSKEANAVALFRIFLTALVIAVAGLLATKTMFPLPDRQGIETTQAIAASDRTRIGAAVLREQAAHPGRSGVIPLAGGGEAFAARVLLAQTAERTLDVQYYIWQGDTTGYLLLDELRAAAERGVRVRLLVDDNGIAGLDAELRALDDLPNMQVRLFNPFTLRRPKLLSFAFDFFRLNRRMHNKSFTVDGAATVVGGRNVGDIYFAFGPDAHYIDTDVLALGPAATDVSEAFDAYWNSASAYPAGMILPAAPDGLVQLQAGVTRAMADDLAAPYLAAISQSPLIRTLMAGPDAVEWARLTLVVDDPGKGLGQQGAGGLLIERLAAILTGAATGPTVSVDLISAYFVPGRHGTGLLTGLAAQGVAVRVLTNAQEATDVMTVHGSYAEYRPALLAGGVGLGELRADPLIPQQDKTLASFLAGSASSLHSKVFAIDGEQVFIGSFNFDPRSARLNTEMGLLIESTTFAKAVTRAVDQVMERGAYALRLSPANAVEWVTQDESGAEIVHATEPNTTWFDRFKVRVIGVLPVEWMM
ncbi:MAG: phospholipase D family protein [Hoeflea sp.]|uniref:phospholipase D family protein n=1 Tax=Hoeflea sp. TaxID=1940281 RepID=UPI0027317CA6|nr:phospholipase D family protein [Hoeflea sp.]MDP2120349.1 phospholipase D family protein [Hoeflea sp.]